MKTFIALPLVLFFGFPSLIFTGKPCPKSKCDRTITRQAPKAKPAQKESKYDKVFSYDNIFYKI